MKKIQLNKRCYNLLALAFLSLLIGLVWLFVHKKSKVSSDVSLLDLLTGNTEPTLGFVRSFTRHEIEFINRTARTEAYILDRLKANQVSATAATIVTISNFGFREFVLNWIASLKRNNFHKFVVFCYDESLLVFLARLGYREHAVLVPRAWLDYDLSPNFFTFAQSEYNHLVQSKTNIWYELAVRGQTFLFSDPDTAWLSPHIVEHVEWSLAHSYAEIIFSQEPATGLKLYNTGFFYAKPTDFVKSLFGSMIETIRKSGGKAMEQHVLNDMLVPRLFNDTRIEGLDLFLYASGNLYFEWKLDQKFELKPYFVHANFFSGKQSKKDALKSRRCWFINHENKI